eukprot:2269273-Pyramimonas_sp.AAC.1
MTRGCFGQRDATPRSEEPSARPPPPAKRGPSAREEDQRGKLEHNARLAVHAVGDATSEIHKKEARAFS